MDEKITHILEKFPFLSYGTFNESDYLGIVQNADNALISMYVLDMIPTEELRQHFLSLGEEWWWGSNRLIPINIFFKDQFAPFKPYIKHFNRKDFELKSGYAVSLQDAISKRVRKKQITIRRKPV